MKDIQVIQDILTSGNLVITPIIGRGEVNRVYSVKHNSEQIIVRLNKEEEIERFKKEAWCSEEALKLGIPSPRIIEIGIKDGLAYMILTFVEGENGKNIINNKKTVWYTIGSYAKKINTISTKGFGETMTSGGSFSDTWARYLTYNIESLDNKDKLLQLRVLNEDQQQYLKRYFIDLKNKQFKFGLVHGDLSLENIIVKNNKVTLIDWGVAESTIVPHMEIINLLQNNISDTDELFDEFLNGYGMDIKIYKSLKPEIEILRLLQAVDKLRWAIDKNPDSIVEFSHRVRSLLF